MNFRIFTGALAALISTSVLAQAQQVKPPVAVYWMNVETAAGMGMGLPSGMGGLIPSSMAGGKRLRLDLGSSQSASGEPRAAHAVPAGLSMGKSLPLLSPRQERAPGRERAEGASEERPMERPKGRMLIYWGCGETVRPGQPVIFNFANLDAQEAARAFRGRSVSRPSGPGPGRNRVYGGWPNHEDSRAVPEPGSLRGDHLIAGNYSPEIRFAIGDRHDFMAAVAFDPIRKSAGGAFALAWRPVPTATGYFATAMGQGENRDDVVMWSSSEVQEIGQALMDYLPPAEVERLIREKVVLTPQTSACSVPAGVFKGEGAMLQFIAYGDELNVVHPPRPSDPSQVWEQQWAVKVRLKSTATALLAEGEGGGQAGGAGARGQEPARASTPPPQRPTQAEQPPSPADAVQEGIKTLRGILRF